MAVATQVERYVALLRGINVGGKNTLPMADLRTLFSAAGCSEVRTYIQSGNVVFRAPPGVAGGIATYISGALAEGFGLQVPVMTRSAAEWRAVAEGNPFLATVEDTGGLHVAFLAATPEAARAAALDPQRSPPDACALRGREVYLHCPNGMARTKLTNAYFDRALGTVSTMRNWRTVLALLELAEVGP